MNNRKKESELTRDLAVTANLEEWIRVDKAADELGITPDAILNNIHDKKYPDLIVRQSLLSRVWYVWLPAIKGFTPQEWIHKHSKTA